MRLSTVTLSLMTLAAVLGTASGAIAQSPQPTPSCSQGAVLNFVCGCRGPEDLVRVPGTEWIIVSGVGNAANPSAGGGELALINAASSARVPLVAGALRKARAPYAECSTPPKLGAFSAHGLSIRDHGQGRSTLFVVGHGEREAIEVYDVVSGDGPPKLTWIGCVPAAPGASNNGVVALSDGRIIVTDFLHAPASPQDIMSGKITGAVYVWKPGGRFEKLPGTDLSGPNGIEVTSDLKYLFVAASGAKSIMRYELAAPERPPAVIDSGVRADNIRWGPNGGLLVAGPKLDKCGDFSCPITPMVVAIDPETLDVSTLLQASPDPQFPAISSALIIGQELWMGSPIGDRVAHTSLKR